MKLRLRNYESKETLSIEVPSYCSLLQLQETLSNLHPSPSYSFRFSLNAKDLLHAQSPNASLQSLGVTPGDLIFYALNPNTFSPIASEEDPQVEAQIQEPNQITESSVNLENPVQEFAQFQEEMSKEPEISQEIEDTESMDIDDFCERVSKPYFLRKVLREEFGDQGSNRKLLAIAVHAALLESGFVRFDPVSGQQIDRFDLPDEWPSPISIFYSLPELLGNRDNSGLPELPGNRDNSDYVVLKFQTLVHFVQVYGSLGKGSLGLYRLSLDEHRFAPTLNLFWANCDKNDGSSDNKVWSCNSYTEKEVFEFWKIVKDDLTLPLMMDLCYRTGLSPPSCLMCLPTELKIRILEFLPGADIARIACVCSEMRHLASYNDLWKLKVREEFGDSASPSTSESKEGNWKMMFRWESRKKLKREKISRRQALRSIVRPFYFPVRRDPNPNPFGAPILMIGGDFDRMPGFSLPPVNLPGPPPRMLRNHGFCCHLGERHDNP